MTGRTLFQFKTRLILVLGVFFCCGLAYSQKDLPINIEDAKVKPLPSLVNSDLQKRLEKELMSNPNWKSLMNNNKMAVGIVDLSNPENAKYASEQYYLKKKNEEIYLIEYEDSVKTKEDE